MPTIDEDMGTEFTNDKHRMLANVVYTGNWVKNQSNDFLKPFELSNPQFNILRILRGAKSWLNMNDVKNRMIEKSPNATRLCDKLVDKKLVERKRSEDDRRVVYLKVSNEGLQLLKKIDDKEASPILEALINIDENDAKTVNEILDRLRG